jgi:hypothetical protein
MHADNGNFDTTAAAGTGYIDGNGLSHYPLCNRGNHRINVVETLVQQVKALPNLLNIRGFGSSTGFVSINHGCTLQNSS